MIVSDSNTIQIAQYLVVLSDYLKLTIIIIDILYFRKTFQRKKMETENEGDTNTAIQELLSQMQQLSITQSACSQKSYLNELKKVIDKYFDDFPLAQKEQRVIVREMFEGLYKVFREKGVPEQDIQDIFGRVFQDPRIIELLK